MMKLVTWNIQWGRGADGRVDLDRIVAQLRRLADDADVLCLQEVSAGYPELAGNDSGIDQFEALAARLADYAPVAATAVDAPAAGGGRRRFGNMLLSRFPVGPVWRHLLPYPADPGVKGMQRVALEATLETPLGRLRVVTTHLEYYSARQRAAQVERLRELHREAVGHARAEGAGGDGPFAAPARGGPAVLVGDFNFRPGSADHARLLAAFDDATPPWRDAWQLAHPGRPHEPTVGLRDKVQWPEQAFTCDFVFVSDDLAPRLRELRVDAGADGSDHQPLLVRLG